MDHRISKDMISSGMIPSGEKKKEDLGRPQYGTAPSPNALADAYKSMYEHHKKDADGNTIPHEGEELNEAGFLAALPALFGKGAAGAAAKGAAGAAAGKAAAGAAAGKAAAGTAAKVTTTGGKVVSGGAPKLGMMGKVKKLVKDNPVQSYYMAKDLTSGGAGTTSVKKTSTMSASADLFDIVKGQLLDEGLSEEEITDIMLTLTPDEIMSEMAVNPNIAAMDAKNKSDMIARAQAKKVPENVKAASKRQYTAGGPKDKGENKYTTQDKKTIIDYNKDKGSM